MMRYYALSPIILRMPVRLSLRAGAAQFNAMHRAAFNAFPAGVAGLGFYHVGLLITMDENAEFFTERKPAFIGGI